MPFYPSKNDQDNAGPEQPDHRRGIVRLIILCASVAMIVFGSVMLVQYIQEYHDSRQTTQELREFAAEAINEPDPPGAENNTATAETTQPVRQPEDETEHRTAVYPADNKPSDMLEPMEYPDGLKVSAKIRKLREKSSDIIGWITMDDLDEPVVMRDNSFFLTHDALGKRNSNGAIFMDEGTGLLTRPYTILLYGHNMKTGAMFGNLRKYEKLSYCTSHQFFNLETLYDDGQYVIFAVSMINVMPGRARYVSLSDIQSLNRTIRRQALESLKNQSVNGVTLDVNEEDQLLLLITCVGDDDERLVVAARRMRDNERTDSLIMKK